jgi:hypothetical protein
MSVIPLLGKEGARGWLSCALAPPSRTSNCSVTLNSSQYYDHLASGSPLAAATEWRVIRTYSFSKSTPSPRWERGGSTRSGCQQLSVTQHCLLVRREAIFMANDDWGRTSAVQAGASLQHARISSKGDLPWRSYPKHQPNN